MNSALKWHGGKSYLAQRIIALMPPHRRFIDLYCGGLNVLLNKPHEGIAEWANDLNGELMNFWNVLRNENFFPAFQRIVEATPLAQDAFEHQGHPSTTLIVGQSGSPIDRAVNFFIRNRMSRQGLGRDYCTPTRRTRRGMNENVSAWLSAVEGLPELHARLKRVELWNRPAVEALRTLDGPDLLVYADPPYLHETRNSTGEYGAFEMTRKDHQDLLGILGIIEGKFILSGYRSDLYDSFADKCGWHRVDIKIANHASSAAAKERKTECLWANFDFTLDPQGSNMTAVHPND